MWKRFKKRTHRVRNLRNDDEGGFDVRNLRNMRAFYRAFPKWNAVRSELTWTHSRILLRVEDDADRRWYMEECIKSGWSSRQLERQISTLYYDRMLASRDKAKAHAV